MTAQELLRERAHHLKAISALRRQAPTTRYELAVHRAEAQDITDAVDRHRAAIAEIDAELDRRRTEKDQNEQHEQGLGP
jgi:hypothetical protein